MTEKQYHGAAAFLVQDGSMRLLDASREIRSFFDRPGLSKTWRAWRGAADGVDDGFWCWRGLARVVPGTVHDTEPGIAFEGAFARATPVETLALASRGRCFS